VGGKLDAKIGNAAANIARSMIDVARVADFETQLAEMRREIADLAERRGA
jgi:hypothetical protein